MLSLPLLFGFLIDCILGDPYSLPHPIRLIGSLIAGLEKLLRPRIKNERTAGTALVITVLILSAGIPLALLIICYKINLILGIAVESIMCYYLVAARCLRNESMKVHDAFAENDTEKARQAFTAKLTRYWTAVTMFQRSPLILRKSMRDLRTRSSSCSSWRRYLQPTS